MGVVEKIMLEHKQLSNEILMSLTQSW